jgi:hypothetical protein
MTENPTRQSDSLPSRKPGDVICFYKLHEDTAKKIGPGKQNEKSEWLYHFRVEAKERPGIVVSVEPNGNLFLWMARSKGRHAFRMTNGEDLQADHRPQEFRTCPPSLVTRKKGQLDPIALGSVMEKLTLEGLGWKRRV